MIVDHVDNLELRDAEQYHNELSALYRLWIGLCYLDNEVRKIEDEARERLNTKEMRVISFSNNPQLEGIPQNLVACAFHWYSVTACSYVQLIGWLVYGRVDEGREYLKRVLPEVSTWRNKVGAHFALVSPRKDNPAVLAQSVMNPLSFDDDAFYVSSLKLSMSSKSQASTSRQDMRWSLTHTHRKLSSRYYPNA